MKKISRRSFLTVAGSAAALTVLAACGDSSSSSSVAASSTGSASSEAVKLDPVTLNVAYMPNYSSLVEVVTGIDAGYF